MKLYIQNMVSLRCKLIVKSELDNMDLHYTIVELGEVEIKEALNPERLDELRRALQRSGLKLMDDKKKILIEKVKTIIIEMVHYDEQLPHNNYSEHIAQKIGYDYTYVSNLFSKVKGTTIEHYIIAHKIERAKELLIYDELTLTQIAYKLGYSSVGHLSNQFKKVTGLTPSFFKNMKHKRLNAHEDL